jgi:hypothetical protein
MRDIRPSGSGEGAVLSRPYLINLKEGGGASRPIEFHSSKHPRGSLAAERG